MSAKLKVFLSYAHEDEPMKDELMKFLVNLRRSQKISVWQDREIVAGQEWDSAIREELVSADIVLLLISADFNASDYIWNTELTIAMERHQQASARVVPIILRPCEWADMPYAKLQALPVGARPVSSYTNRDEAYTEIARGVRQVVDRLSGDVAG
jgi:hypothetical protein